MIPRAISDHDIASLRIRVERALLDDRVALVAGQDFLKVVARLDQALEEIRELETRLENEIESQRYGRGD